MYSEYRRDLTIKVSLFEKIVFTLIATALFSFTLIMFIAGTSLEFMAGYLGLIGIISSISLIVCAYIAIWRQ